MWNEVGLAYKCMHARTCVCNLMGTVMYCDGFCHPVLWDDVE